MRFARILLTTIFILSSNLLFAQEFPETIKPLLQTKWGQKMPYNILCPKLTSGGESKRMKAGCVPVAMAQIIKYYRYPAISPDKKYHYLWDKMTNTADAAMDREKLVAIGKLISDCGVVARTNYGIDQSGSFARDAVSSLKYLFNYSKYMRMIHRDSLKTPEEQAQLLSTIFEELKAGRPIICSGKLGVDSKGKDERHMFVIDGCKGKRVHVNFGWEGYEDGYYSLDDLGGYALNQTFIVGVSPDYKPTVTEIKLSTAGTLAQQISGKEEHLKITGALNASDFDALKKLRRNLISIDLKDAQVEEIPDTAFGKFKNLVNVVLPSRVKKIGRMSFAGCVQLSNVEFPQQLEQIGNAAFAGCLGLVDIQLPSSIRKISSYAFTLNASLIYVTLPEGLTSLGDKAFYGCIHLFRLTLPKSLTKVGEDITGKCPKLNKKS